MDKRDLAAVAEVLGDLRRQREEIDRAISMLMVLEDRNPGLVRRPTMCKLGRHRPGRRSLVKAFSARHISH